MNWTEADIFGVFFPQSGFCPFAILKTENGNVRL